MADLATLGLAIDSGPAVQAAAALDKLAVSAQGVGASSDRLIAALDRNAAMTSSLTKQLAAYAATAGIATAANATLGASVAPVTAGMQASTAAAQQAAVGMKTVAAATGSNVVSLNAHRAALNQHTAATGLNRMQMLELSHVAKSLFDDMAAGQPIFRSLAMEGGRIGEIFGSSSGGVGGVLKGIGSSISGLLSPITLAIGGFIGLGAAAVYSVVSYEEAQRKLEASTNGIGRFSGLGIGGLNQVAANGARAGNLSTSQGRDLAGTFNSTGRISGTLNEQLIGSAKTYARTVGESDISAAGEQLAKAFSDPTKGADLLNEKLGFLDDKTKELVRTQVSALDVFGAQETLFTAYNADLATAVDHTSALARVWDTAKRSASDFFGGIGEGIARRIMPTDQDELDRLTNDRATLDHARGRGTQAHRDALDAQIAPIQGRVDAAQDKTQDAAAEIAANRLSISGGDIIRRALPDIGRRTDLETNIGGLKALTSDPDAMDKLSGTARDGAAKALDNLTGKLEHFATAAQVVAQDSDFATRATLARTLAQRVAVESERSYADVMRTTGDRALAAATAEGKRAEMIALGTKAIMDSLRESMNERALVGLSAYDKNLATVQQQHDKLVRDNLITDGATDATKRLTAALDRNADALAGRATVGGSPPVGALPTGITSSLVAAIEHVESGGRKDTGFSRSLGEDGRPSSAFGAGQITKGAEADIKTRVPGFDRTDPAQADLGVSTYLKILQDRNGGSEDAAIKAYRGSKDPSVNDAYLRQVRAAQNSTTMLPQVTVNPNAKGMADQDLANRKYNATTGQFITSIDASNRALEVQTATFKLQGDILGQTPPIIANATKQQELLNAAYERGAISSLEFGKQTDELQAKLKAAGSAAGAFAVQEQDRQRATAIGDGVRGGFKDSAMTLSTDLIDHRYAGEKDRGRRILDDIGQPIASKVLSSGLDGISNGLFGKQGTAGGGILGGLFGSFGGGGALSSANIQAGVVNITSGIGSVLGGVPGIGAATGGGSLGGGLFGGLAKLFGFADGGVMSSGGSLPLHRYASGGVANTPQLAMFGEGRGPEAYVPLADGRTIPVSVKGGGGAPSSNTFATGGHTIIVQGSADKGMLEAMDRKLAEANAAQKADLSRNFGNYQRRYGANYG